MERRKRSFSLKAKIVGLLSTVLVVLLFVDIAWTYHVQENATKSVLLEESRMLVAEMDAVWTFISINQDTINYTSDGTYEYKGLHCAIAGKSVAAFFSRNSDYVIRFTKTDPRNFHNAPDAYESSALGQFAKLTTGDEFYGFSEHDGESVFRYVSAMKVSENCIECHGKPAGQIDPTGFPKEGWNIGDVAGAVSVIVPTELYFSNMKDAIVANVLFFVAILLCMVMVIYLVLTRLITNPLTNLQQSFIQMSDRSSTESSKASFDEGGGLYASREINEVFDRFNSMADGLSSLYESLESLVDERTTQLSEANAELERQRRHVEEINGKLKQENEYKSDFLAIVSHELRTPLTSVLAFADLMEQNIASENDRAHKQLEEIDKNGRILLEMVDNVLETARIQTGSEKLNLELVDLNDVVGIVETSSESLALKKEIVLSTHMDASVPLIMSDWEKMRRILANLVSNAIKFTDYGGSVHVSVWFNRDAERVLIQVIDNGIGIPLNKQELIFERFTQENMSTARRYGGSGLGLSLVRDLVHMLQGSIEVTSTVGEGSTFSVSLPTGLNGGGDYDESNVN